MNKLTKVSFSIFKYSALGFNLLFFLMKFISAGAGHPNAISLSFGIVVVYSLLLFFIIQYYQKISNVKKVVSSSFKGLFILVVIPSILLAFAASIALLYKSIEVKITNGSILAFLISSPVILVLLAFVFFGIIIIKYVLNSNSKS